MFIANFAFSQSVYFNNLYEGNAGWWDFGMSIIETDTSYILGGGTRWVFNYDDRLSFWNFDKSGNLNFVKNYGDTSWRFPGIGGGSLIKTNDNGFLQTGITSDYFGNDSHGYLFKLDSQLDSLWYIKLYNDTTFKSRAVQVRQLSDSGFIVAGADNTIGNYQIFFLRTDKDGGIVWKKPYNYSNGNEYPLSIDTTQDGGFIIAGMTEVTGTATWDAYVIKTDSSGDFQWQRTFGIFDESDVATSVKSTANGDILVAGGEWKYNITPGNFDYYQAFIARLDINNNLLWKKNYGTATQNSAVFNSIKQLPDGNIVAVGGLGDTLSPYNACMIVKTNANGDVIWLREFLRFTDTITSDNYFWDFVPTSDSGFAIAGHIVVYDFPNPYQDAWVLKLDSMGCPYPECDTATGIIEINPFLRYGEMAKIFPNPATDNITVTGYYSLPATFNIYNIEGKLLLQKTITTHYENININTLLSGVCIYTVDDGKGNIYKGKFIIR